MESSKNINFLLISDVKGLHFHFERPEGIEFKPKSDCDLHFSLKPNDPKEDAFGHHQGLVCRLYATYSVTEEQLSFVKSLINDKKVPRFADGISLPFKPMDKVLIATDGTLDDGYLLRRYFCPSDIINMIEFAESDLSTKTDRFLKLLRWRQNFNAPGEVIRHSTLYWGVDGEKYHHTPREGDPHHFDEVDAMYGIHWDDNYISELEDLWSINELNEPLGHSLFREAVTLASVSPLSAILILVAALETAVKTHISHIAPETAWLMEKLQSPPVFNILKDYIPDIYQIQGKKIEFWDKIRPSIKRIQKIIKIRNKVAHTGKIPPEGGLNRDDFRLISDILYILDVLEGHEWAKTMVSNDLRRLLDWPAPKEIRYSIKISYPI
jgi:hypothetical protein